MASGSRPTPPHKSFLEGVIYGFCLGVACTVVLFLVAPSILISLFVRP